MIFVREAGAPDPASASSEFPVVFFSDEAEMLVI
jgi:hypothetical protein